MRRAGQQKVPHATPQAIPDQVFNELFAQLSSNRDRALVAFYVSSGARASELLEVTGEAIDPGQNRVLVHRKGDRREQWIPASQDAFVWLSLYLGSRSLRSGEPVWLTLREPLRPLNYHALRKVFQRAQEVLGTRYTLHQLRHTAAYRMVRDPNLSLTDVAWVLGHASVTTTQIYTVPLEDDLLARMAAHFARPPAPAAHRPANYDADALDVLFGGRHV
nr:site-specific integrase [Leifsonia soli]